MLRMKPRFTALFTSVGGQGSGVLDNDHAVRSAIELACLERAMDAFQRLIEASVDRYQHVHWVLFTTHARCGWRHKRRHGKHRAPQQRCAISKAQVNCRSRIGNVHAQAAMGRRQAGSAEQGVRCAGVGVDTDAVGVESKCNGGLQIVQVDRPALDHALFRDVAHHPNPARGLGLRGQQLEYLCELLRCMDFRQMRKDHPAQLGGSL
jgi:hypothetical protein